MTVEGRWNHNIHYHRVVLGALPTGCARALDVGCGEGMLARQLRRAGVPEVVGIDPDEPSIALAEATSSDDGLKYVVGDVRDDVVQPGSFDLVASIATLHHMDAREGLTRVRELVRPGGVLVVVGLARPRGVKDLAVEPASVVAMVYRRLLRQQYWEHSAPTVWPPPETYGGMRRIARQVLPGVRYRRHLYWRYSLVWRAPA
ncbi:class I SAM-dependent methyltransferase [Pseudonocardia sp. TRM90224]|uniref:class I SAM-dependent methyltransferase n=1 Tax=Pseudonocardia sp. TRM90224 TaxID=2812678 RepID=UPI001E44F0E4|nr:class I SAM-dependent methyltransferase [Pseudonocardia sp. TRM90224]